MYEAPLQMHEAPLRFVTSILKSVVFLAISLSLSSVIYSQIALFFALNHTCQSKSHNLYCESLHFCSKSHHFCFAYEMRFQCIPISLSTNLLLDQWNSVTNWSLRIELGVVQFWSAIILGSNHAEDFRPNHGTPLCSITIINALDLRLSYRWQKIISITLISFTLHSAFWNDRAFSLSL